MSNIFTYSILQYHHSQVLGESLNVGMLFHFPDEPELYFATGNTSRVKAAYPNFDTTLFNTVIRGIRSKLAIVPPPHLFLEAKAFLFKDYIFTTLLAEDSIALQFSDPQAAVNNFATPHEAVESYTRIFLPETAVERAEVQRHNDQYLLKKCTDLIISRNINIEHRMRRDRIVEAKKVKLNVDLSWQNGIEHLIKPISFDLLSEREIQDKSVRFFGYLNLLGGYAIQNNCTFDLLVAAPQESTLRGAYEDAVETLQSAQAPLEIIPEESLSAYSDSTATILHHKDLE